MHGLIIYIFVIMCYIFPPASQPTTIIFVILDRK